MGNVAVIGLQWGDEGKGKIVDVLSADADAVVRFQGGHNAGHTISIAGETRILHLIPSGILRPGVECLIGGGAVVSVPALIDELGTLARMGIDAAPRLKISPLCPLVFSSHRELDEASEAKRSGEAIGTTAKGIGPAYEDRAGRRALRMQHLADPEDFARQLEDLFEYHNFILQQYYGRPPADWRADYDFIMRHRDAVMKMMHPVPDRLKQLADAGKNVLFEGAQGAMLDIDHGTYPFVTSSHTLAGHVTCGAGFPARLIGRTVGVCKAYATRVGNGPFPTEVSGRAGEHMARRGAEFGATTGRARRCGWLDLVLLRRAVWLNGVDVLCLTKLDVLAGLESVRVCTAYEEAQAPFDRCRPEYAEFGGWGEMPSHTHSYEDLPAAVREYVEYIEKETNVAVGIISTGPGRETNIIRTPIF